jgi:hypothetical protein
MCHILSSQLRSYSTIFEVYLPTLPALKLCAGYVQWHRQLGLYARLVQAVLQSLCLYGCCSWCVESRLLTTAQCTLGALSVTSLSLLCSSPWAILALKRACVEAVCTAVVMRVPYAGLDLICCSRSILDTCPTSCHLRGVLCTCCQRDACNQQQQHLGVAATVPMHSVGLGWVVAFD